MARTNATAMPTTMVPLLLSRSNGVSCGRPEVWPTFFSEEDEGSEFGGIPLFRPRQRQADVGGLGEQPDRGNAVQDQLCASFDQLWGGIDPNLQARTKIKIKQPKPN